MSSEHELLREAMRRQATGELTAAEKAYRALLEWPSLDPESAATAHSNLGFILGVTRRDDQAIAHLEAATQLRPDDPVAHLNLAIALQEATRYTQSITHCKIALQLRPRFVAALINLATSLMYAGDVQ